MINIYMTTGTRSFMDTVREKHSKEQIIMMHGEGHTLLLHETEGNSVFQSPRKYEVISSSGQLEHEGFFVFNNIAVSDEGRPVFEHRFSKRAELMDTQPGFVAFRLLRPLESDTYIVLTEWKESSYFDLWKHSAAFKKSHEQLNTKEYADNTTHIFTSASYITTYVAKEDDE